MTREEILKMEAGPEMDALVATRVMGWRLHPHKTGWVIPETPEAWNAYRKRGDWNPSTDIKDTWVVTEKLMAEELTPCIWAEKVDCIGWMWRCLLNHNYADVLAKTVPLAICRAALLATL
jgi:hypothetical protein